MLLEINSVLSAVLGCVIGAAVVILIYRKLPIKRREVTVDMSNSKADSDAFQKIIENIFRERQWRYGVDVDERGDIHYFLGLNGSNEQLQLHITVFVRRCVYLIVCQSETSLPVENIGAGIIAANKYNARRLVGNVIIDEEGNMLFWISRIMENGAFSERALAAEIDLCINQADDDTAQLYKYACMGSCTN